MVIKESIIEEESLALRLSSCRALAKIANLIDLQQIKQHLPMFFQQLFGLLNKSNEDTLHLVLETISVLIRKDEETA